MDKWSLATYRLDMGESTASGTGPIPVCRACGRQILDAMATACPRCGSTHGRIGGSDPPARASREAKGSLSATLVGKGGTSGREWAVAAIVAVCLVLAAGAAWTVTRPTRLSDAEATWCSSHLYEMYLAARTIGVLPHSWGLLGDGFDDAVVDVIRAGPIERVPELYGVIRGEWESSAPESYKRACQAAFGARS